MQKPFLIDVTLRDGDQSPGVAFNTRDKVVIARMLDRVGVFQIEAGIPAMGAIEQNAVQAVAALDLNCHVSSWNRMVPGDVTASLACGIRNIHVCVPVSDIHLCCKVSKSRNWVFLRLKETVSFAKSHGCRVTVGAEDASRADELFLFDVAQAAFELGAERLRYSDTLGILNPFTTFEHISRLREKVKGALEFHGHNDFGMATANALAAWEAGCSYIDVSVGGLGERAGNTPLEEFVRSLRGLYGVGFHCKDRDLQALTYYVARAANRDTVSAWLPRVQRGVI